MNTTAKLIVSSSVLISTVGLCLLLWYGTIVLDRKLMPSDAWDVYSQITQSVDSVQIQVLSLEIGPEWRELSSVEHIALVSHIKHENQGEIGFLIDRLGYPYHLYIRRNEKGNIEFRMRCSGPDGIVNTVDDFIIDCGKDNWLDILGFL